MTSLRSVPDLGHRAVRGEDEDDGVQLSGLLLQALSVRRASCDS